MAFIKKRNCLKTMYSLHTSINYLCSTLSVKQILSRRALQLLCEVDLMIINICPLCRWLNYRSTSEWESFWTTSKCMHQDFVPTPPFYEAWTIIAALEYSHHKGPYSLKKCTLRDCECLLYIFLSLGISCQDHKSKRVVVVVWWNCKWE